MAVVAALRDELEQALLASIPNSFVTGDVANRVPNTTTIAFEYVEGEAILLLLNQLGIAASSGSACTSGSLEPSHVMRAMGVPYTAAHGAIRCTCAMGSDPADRHIRPSTARFTATSRAAATIQIQLRDRGAVPTACGIPTRRYSPFGIVSRTGLSRPGPA